MRSRDNAMPVRGRWRAHTTLIASGVLLLAAFFPWGSLNSTLSIAGIRVFEGRTCLLLAVAAGVFSIWRLLRPRSGFFLLTGVAGAAATLLVLVFAIRIQFLTSTLRTSFGANAEQVKEQSGLDYGWYLGLFAALVIAVIALLDHYVARRQSQREKAQREAAKLEQTAAVSASPQHKAA